MAGQFGRYGILHNESREYLHVLSRYTGLLYSKSLYILGNVVAKSDEITMTMKTLVGWQIFTLVEAKSAAILAAKPPLGEIPCGTFLQG